jgi:2-keto-4-pentenoate hydratase/2-oxohepta-3-ene-1,7-dioic acid hydratase in catechol pathway
VAPAVVARRILCPAGYWMNSWHTMKHLILALVLSLTASQAVAQDQPFKLGTFERDGRRFVGIVVRDTMVIDFAAASAAVRSGNAAVMPPADMKDLIARYDQGFRRRIQEVIAAAGAAGSQASYVYPLSGVKTLPPIMYPTTMINTALNYREHAAEMAGLNSGPPAVTAGAPPPGTAPPGTQSAPGVWERAAGDSRWNPYMFLKSPAAIVANGEAIRLPLGRDQIDWECELGVVIGGTASRVSANRAADVIFGYTIENDVSDRGGRGDDRYGSDWLIGKSHDTFAPMGPFIVPKEFAGDPRKLNVKFTLNGQLMQDASTALMIHDVFEQVSYASNIMTLRPGDVIATGSPAGVGSARKPPIFFKAGDVAVCTYEGIGALTNPVVAAPK